jgi:hypothetical protein
LSAAHVQVQLSIYPAPVSFCAPWLSSSSAIAYPAFQWHRAIRIYARQAQKNWPQGFFNRYPELKAHRLTPFSLKPSCNCVSQPNRRLRLTATTNRKLRDRTQMAAYFQPQQSSLKQGRITAVTITSTHAGMEKLPGQ